MFTQAIIFLFSAWLLWVLALGQLFIKHKDADHYVSAVFFFSLGVWIIMAGSIWTSPYLVGFHIGFTYIRAALFYFYFRKIIDPEFGFARRHLVHFLPGVIVFLVLLPVSFQGATLNVSVMDILIRGMGTPSEKIFSLLMFVALAVHIPYLLDLLNRYKNLFFVDNSSSSTRVVLFQIVYSIVAICTAVAEQHVYGQMQALSMWMATLAALVFFLSSMRYPEYIRLIKLETEKARYAQSRIQGLNLERILGEMQALMTERMVYTDEELTLAKLADLLSIAPQQLSEILNARLHKGFYEYINDFRVERARQLLLEQPQTKIASIAHDVGFNSMSAFYKAFHKITGDSPGAFRKRGGRLEEPPA